MTSELSKPVIKGLNYLGRDIDMEITKKLIQNTLKHTLSSEASIPSMPDIYATNSEKATLGEYAIVTLIAVAIKHSYDAATFRHIVEKHNVQPDVIEELVHAYKENHKELIIRQLQLGNDFPHITDVQWRIMADVCSSICDSSSGQISFHINLGRYHTTSGERETIIEFVCNTEELHMLINKLKEIERHCENIAKG